jgi:hypothetical protein
MAMLRRVANIAEEALLAACFNAGFLPGLFFDLEN